MSVVAEVPWLQWVGEGRNAVGAVMRFKRVASRVQWRISHGWFRALPVPSSNQFKLLELRRIITRKKQDLQGFIVIHFILGERFVWCGPGIDT